MNINGKNFKTNSHGQHIPVQGQTELRKNRKWKIEMSFLQKLYSMEINSLTSVLEILSP